jgi:hypothetical protein
LPNTIRSPPMHRLFPKSSTGHQQVFHSLSTGLPTGYPLT